MSETEVLKNMVMSFRVSELTMLLSFAGRSRSGRKTELQMRALELIKLRSSPINAKVRELYRSIQQQTVAMGQSATETTPPYIGASTRSSSSLSPSKSSNYSEMERAALQGRNPYIHTSGLPYSTGYTSKQAVSASGSQPSFPVHPDVRLKRLPFFDSIAELLRPSSLVPTGNSRYHDTNFVFHLTPQQATDIASSRDARPGSKIDFLNQIQMRFCLLETSCEQEDNFPSNLSVKVNSKLVTLPNPIPTNKPGVEPKRPPRPVNITSLCRLSPTVANQINVTWSSDIGGRGYVMAVYVVRRLASTDLLQRLRTKGMRAAEYTRGLIRDKLEDADAEIATTSLKVSLVCPLGKMRMQLPCRATTCSHLQCFDASLFLQMNERKPTWVCPVCDKSILYDQLAIDGYFSDILNSQLLPSDIMEVQLNVDGNWTVLSAKKETKKNTCGESSVNLDVVEELPTNPTNPKVETIDETELELVCEGPPPKKKAPMVVDLTLSSDSEEDSDTLMSIKERMLSRQRSSGSQSSCPGDSADENAAVTNAPVNLSSNVTTVTGSSNSSLSSSASNSSARPAQNFESASGVNSPLAYNYMAGSSYGSPTYFPYSSSTTNGQNLYGPYSGYVYPYGGPNELQSVLGDGMNGHTLPSAASQHQSSNNSVPLARNNYRRSQSPPDVISLD
ncbi:E3 SUMO-protein ligase PIAS3 [Daphnia magna]|uniref:E3 SUMO-protein ligase PIAS3 n=1 Tax=Daphnia magna TaxID=35525 RepID=A0A0N8DA50_9CRUS|nr:E3 SUMO-protein ligase PIAS3 [Daphnia magna]